MAKRPDSASEEELEELRARLEIPRDVELERSRCPLAPDAPDEEVLVGKNWLHGTPGKWRIVRNRVSGLMRTDPRPTERAILDFYPTEYTPYRTRAARAYRSSMIRRFLNWIDPFSIPRMEPSTVLEVGCANGSFLERMRRSGWEAYGIEPNPVAAEYARQRGFEVQTGLIETVERPSRKFDLVVAWMAVEHFHDPLGALRRLHRWTHSRGQLALSVPDCSSLEFPLFGDKWYASQLPSHLFHYTPDSMSALLAATGWRITRVERHKTLNNWIGSLGILLEANGLAPSLGKKLKQLPSRMPRGLILALLPLATLAAALGQTGRMTIHAERVDER